MADPRELSLKTRFRYGMSLEAAAPLITIPYKREMTGRYSKNGKIGHNVICNLKDTYLRGPHPKAGQERSEAT
jgi:hypothetical protein